MRRKIGIVILVFAIIVFITSAVTEFTMFFYELRLSPKALKSWWGSDKGGSGDLYGFTSLPQFRDRYLPGENYIVKAPDCSGIKKTYNIYAYTDSYTKDFFMDVKNFCGAFESNYAFSNYGEILPVYLDKSKKNILMIECVERDIRTRLADSTHLLRCITVSKEKISKIAVAKAAHNIRLNFKYKNADSDYETNLWDYRFLRPLKELKAKMNFELFNRTNTDAVVSPDGKFLLYQRTIDTSYSQSSYKPISNTELNTIVEGLNKVYNHYKQLGFDEIYLSVIPNPTTILYPDYKGMHYNQLIPRLENHPALKLKVFDIYNLFKNSPEKDKIFQRSDTHWTEFGSHLWLNEFNKEMTLNNYVNN